MTKHARLSASSSAKWLNCPGSIKAEEPYPNTSSAAAEEGTRAHELAEELLSNGICSGEYTKDMLEYVTQYVSYVDGLTGKYDHRFIEQTFSYSDYARDGFGTADAVIVEDATDIVHVVDLKYGFSEVSAVDNTQLMLYALGFMAEYPLLDISRFVLHIFQPRIRNISVHEVSVADLMQFGEHVRERTALTLQDNPERIAGDKQCQWCRAKASCPALNKLVEETTMTTFSDLDAVPALPKIETLTDEQRKRILDNKALIIKFMDSVESSVFDDVNSGKGFDGYKIVGGRSRRQWGVGADEILIGELGDKAYKKSLIGIGDAEKLLSKSEVNSLLVKAPGKPTLVKDSDKRDAITSADQFDKLD